MDNDQEEIQTGEEVQDEGSPEPEEQEQEQETATAEEEIVVSIGEQQQQEEPSETEWLKDLRKSWKSYKKENQQLKQELEKIKETKKPAAEALDPGPKPRLDDAGIDYDTDIYDKRLDAWHEAKRLRDEEIRRAKEEEARQNESWQKQLNRYHERKKSLPVKDFEDVEMVVEDILNPTQQGIIVQGAKNPELVVYALGKNPGRAKELASIKNPVNFAFAIAELESQLKTSKRKVTTQPEKTVSSTGRISGSVDSTLNKLRQEAEKTGDYSKVMEFRRKMKSKAA